MMTEEQTTCYVCSKPVTPTQPFAQSTVVDPETGDHVVITRHLSCEPVATEG